MSNLRKTVIKKVYMDFVKFFFFGVGGVRTGEWQLVQI